MHGTREAPYTEVYYEIHGPEWCMDLKQLQGLILCC